MVHLDMPVVRHLPSIDGPLLSLGDGFAARFHSWHGASGRRYVMSVFAADPRAPDAGLPEFDACVLVAVARDGECRRVVGIVTLERGSDRRLAVARFTPAGTTEWHVHFLAGDRRERAAIVADLQARHVGGCAALTA